MSLARAAQLREMAMEALAEVKRTPMSGLSRVVSLLVIDEALAKASQLSRAASGMETRQGGNEVPSRSDDSPAPKGDAQ